MNGPIVLIIVTFFSKLESQLFSESLVNILPIDKLDPNDSKSLAVPLAPRKPSLEPGYLDIPRYPSMELASLDV